LSLGSGRHSRVSQESPEILAGKRLERTRLDHGAMTTATMHQTPLGLSATEERIAELVAAGSSNREIAECLYLSRHTIEAHLTHIFTKLRLRSRVDLAVLMVRRELSAA
jgi:DNA-binding CsgD family transcriptional regulator